MKLLLLALLLSGACKEFYDEEYLQDLEEERNTTGSGGGDGSEEARAYSATLNTTDARFPNMTGTSSVNINGDQVTVNLTLNGIPQNLIQVHYTFLAAPCTNLNVSLPGDATATRSTTISETLTLSALAQDLASSGASGSAGDTNLTGKSFVVKAFSNFGGVPNPTGTNQLTLACGSIVQGSAPDETDTTTTGGVTTTTGGTAAGTTGTTTGTTTVGTTTTTGGAIGGTVAGTVAGTAGGVGGVGGTIGGETAGVTAGGTLGGNTLGTANGGGFTDGGTNTGTFPLTE